MTSKTGLEFKVGDAVVYPAHGVGKVAAIETQEVAGMALEVYVVTFEHEKMTLRVPTKKAKTAGLRTLAADDTVSKALTTLKGRARVKRTMWSRRAQEYEAKINSGDLISIAEVVRDLHRAETQPEQSYSERQLSHRPVVPTPIEIDQTQEAVSSGLRPATLAAWNTRMKVPP